MECLVRLIKFAQAVALSIVVILPVHANDTEEMMRMVRALKERVEQLEYQLAQQSRKVEQVEAIANGSGRPKHFQALNKRLERLEKAKKSDHKFDGVEFHGIVEVEAVSGDDHTGADGSDLALSAVELGFDFRVFDDWVTGSFAALHEDDDTDKWEVDQAFITIGNTNQFPAYVSAGRLYVPFGNYQTNLVSDPMTLEIGETRETTLQLGFEKNNWYGSGYIFNGDMDETGDDKVDNYGFNFGYAREGDEDSLDVGVSWINNLADSNGLEAMVTGPLKDHVAAYSLHGVYRTGPWSFIGEYITATESYQRGELRWKAGGAQPSAYNLEIGYDFVALGGRDSNVAFALQGTDEALALALPENKWLVGMSTTLYDNTSLAIEYANAEDYSVNDGGTGKDGNVVTLQVAVDF